MKIKRKYLKILVERYLFEQEDEDKKEDEESERKSVEVEYPDADNEKRRIGNQIRAVFNASQEEENKEDNIDLEVPKELARVLNLKDEDDETPTVALASSKVEDLFKKKGNELRPYTNA